MIELTHNPIDFAAVLASVNSHDAGANVLFTGTTRRMTGNEETIRLDYDGYHDMAVSELTKLANEAKQKWPVIACSIVHRLGTVELGEASVAVAVSTPHRSESFAAAEWILNQLKQRVPIWKRDHRPGGVSQWQHPDSGRVSAFSPPSNDEQPESKA
ncbi:MAG: molybdenum cofactor biosynthesis protein MoaE [Planctomycetota bacterium]